MGSTDFNGTTSRLGVSNDAITAGSVTGMAWVRWDGAGEGTVGAVMGDAAFFFGMSGNTTTLWCNYDYGTTDASSTTGAIFTTGVWYCLAATHDEADKKNRIYYGTESQRMQEIPTYATQTAGVGSRATSQLVHFVGDWAGADRSFDGRGRESFKINALLSLDEMELWRRGDLTVPFKRGVPHMYFTLDNASTVDSSRRGTGTGTVTAVALTASSEVPAGIQFEWDWARNHPLRRTVATAAGVTGTLAQTLANATSSASGYQAYPLNETFDATQSFWTGTTVATGTVGLNAGRLEMVVPAPLDAAQYLLADTLPADVELRASYTFTVGTNQTPAFNFRGDGIWQGSGNRQLFTNGLALIPNTALDTVTLFTTVASSSSVVGSAYSLVIAATDTVHFHVLLNGSSVQWKAWLNSDPEPGVWQSGTDSNHSARKRLGLALQSPTAAPTTTAYWDNVVANDLATFTGTLTETLDNATSAAAGGAGASGTLTETLDNLTSAAAGTYSPTGTLAETLDNVTVAASGTFSPTGTLAETLADVTSTTQGHIPVTGTVAETLGDITPTIAAGHGASGTLAETLANTTVVASGDHNTTGTVARTLANVTSTTQGYAAVTGTVARTLQNATAAASGGSTNAAALAETLDPVVVQATGGVGAIGTLARTLGNATVVATGAASAIAGTVAVTLDSVEVNSPLTDETGDAITDESGDPILVRGAEGSHGIGGTVAYTLADVVSTATGAVVYSGTLAETLDDVTVSAAGTSAQTGTVSETLDDVTAATVGSVGATGTTAVTLANATSAADGTSTPPDAGAAGSVNATLENATSAADGSSVAGELAETLADATSSASGTFTIAGTVAVTLGNVTSAASGQPGVSGTLERSLANILGDAVGSTVTGTVDEVLDDIESTTTGAVTVTVYSVGRPVPVFHMGKVGSVFDTGRVVAIAGSRR